MNLSKMLSGFEALSALSVMDGVLVDVVPAVKPAGTARIGDVVMALGVANDISVPANDSYRPNVLAQRALRRERRENRSL